MKFFKLLLILLTVSAFILSCGQAGTSPNVKNTVTNTASANSTPNSITSGTVGNSSVNKPQSQTEAVTINEEQIDLYGQNCMICHKVTGKGGKITLEGKTMNPADLTSEKIKVKSNDKLLAAIKGGVPEEGMPAFEGKLSDDDIKAIIHHIRELK